MNAEPNIELPGLDEVVGREIRFVAEDCDRLEKDLRATTAEIAGNTAEQARLVARMRVLRAGEADLRTKAATVKRMLTARRRVLFEMEQEVQP